ncbi:uncharacterized protein C6orf47 homolog [Heptranchias perlo]|uniref:uncharacterized protein C6orf47 homolog n=1 Tax=Heptranchias perlo TaxID=212740 RepID=UPI00355A8990
MSFFFLSFSLSLSLPFPLSFLLLNSMGNTAQRPRMEATLPQGSEAGSSLKVKRARWFLRIFPNLAALLARALGWIRASLRWFRRSIKARGKTQLGEGVKLEKVDHQQLEEQQVGKEAAAGGPQGPTGQPERRSEAPEHLEISFNFVRHLFDMLVVGFLCLASPVFRVALDVVGLRGMVKLWLHGMALFLVASYGMALVLWLVQTYIVQLAFLFGGVQLMVLGVSIQHQEEMDLEMETQEVEDSKAPPGP